MPASGCRQSRHLVIFMNGKTCFFIGRRDTTDDVLPALRAAIEQHITEYSVAFMSLLNRF